MTPRRQQLLLMLAFTAIFIGYLTVWLPGPGAGLSFLGVEMGEWFKFLGLGGRRDLFYLPPITLGLMLAIWTVTWPRQRWQAWFMRGMAVLVSLLALPAIEDITGAAREQYVLRVVLIGLVVLAALVSGFWQPTGRQKSVPWILLAILGLIGFLLPTWMFLVVRPFASQIIGVSMGIGLGILLNGAGHLLVTAASLPSIRGAGRPATSAQRRKT